MGDKLYHLSKLVQVLEMNPQFTVLQLQTMYGYLQHVCKTSTKMYSNIHVQTQVSLTIMVNKVVHIILIPKEKVFVLWSCKAFPLRSFS